MLNYSVFKVIIFPFMKGSMSNNAKSSNLPPFMMSKNVSINSDVHSDSAAGYCSNEPSTSRKMFSYVLMMLNPKGQIFFIFFFYKFWNIFYGF